MIDSKKKWAAETIKVTRKAAARGKPTVNLASFCATIDKYL
jgi:hypothetical protein